MVNRIEPSVDLDPIMLAQREPPLVSLFLKTHRRSPENQQDPIRFRQLLSQIEESLEKGFDKRQVTGILSKLEALVENPDRSLWRHPKDGLAVFADKDEIFIYQTDYPVDDIAIVSSSFHVKPLIRNFQYGAHYYLLALSMDKMTLYRGDFKNLEELLFPEDVKTRFEEIYADFDGPGAHVVSSVGTSDARYYGYGSKNDVVEKDIIKYFRDVDDLVRKYFIDEHPLPVILVGLPQNQAAFRSIASLPGLLETGIGRPAESMDNEQLLATATELIRSMQETAIRKLLEDYGFAESKEQGSSDPSTIARALAERKVAILFVEEGKLLPGCFDDQTGVLTYDDIENPMTDDLVDDFAQSAYQQGGKVYALDKDTIPGESGVAAIFRY